MVTPNLTNTVFAKSQYSTVISTAFTELNQPQTEQPAQPTTISISEFFNNYDTLFFEIPKFGETNSHEYLIKTSSDYIQAEFIDSTIQALLDEITQLREDNVQLTQQLAETQVR